MLDKLKQLSQLKAMQDQMKEEKFAVQKVGVKVIVNGNLIVEEIILENQQVDAQLIKDCINEAIYQAQQAMAQKFAGLDFGL